MARVLRLKPSFLRRRGALRVVRGSAESEALSATLAALIEAEELPGALDALAAIPPTGRAYVRRVAGWNLWIWYTVPGLEVAAVRLPRIPPVPVDE